MTIGKNSGDLRDPSFVQRLGDEDYFLDPSRAHGLVERTHITHSHNIDPFAVFTEHLTQRGETL